VSGLFKFPDADHYYAWPLKSFAETGTHVGRRSVVELGYGIGMITLWDQERHEVFVLEVDIQQDAPPTLGLLLAKDKKKLEMCTERRLTSERVKVLPEGEVRSNSCLLPGMRVAAVVSKRARMGQKFYVITVGLEEEAAEGTPPASLQSLTNLTIDYAEK
jgi:hypothetical protein